MVVCEAGEGVGVDEPGGFEDFVVTRSRGLLRAGWLLTGDWAAAEDLVQSALAETWKRWDRLDTPDAYTRRVMMTTFLRWRRRRWAGEVASAALPERAAADAIDGADLRQALVAALQDLPAKQRAVVVLRYFADLTEAQTAQALDCSVGSVKTHASRAMARLREDASLQDLLGEETAR